MKNTTITVNQVLFKEIPNKEFVIYGELDKVPFMDSELIDINPNAPTSKVGAFPYRIYRSLIFDRKYYAPSFDENGNLITL